MVLKYLYAPDIEKEARIIIHILGWNHIDLVNVGFLRSVGSTANYTIARCHGLGNAMRTGMQRKKSFYVIEVISERFDHLPRDEQIRIIIHELMHIPKSFGGGFIHHNKVNERTVNKIYKTYCELRYKLLINHREEDGI